jgi:eukaryotic-like serine/threonine-protein kinase
MPTPIPAGDTGEQARASCLPGTRLGPYEILELIGLGGMGEVYRARDTRLDRIVAIKMLPRIAALDPTLRARVEQEARTVAAISHPHICALFDIGREGEIDYFVMEFIEGETLAHRLADGALPLGLVLEFGTQIAGALAAAHRHGAVHCDLKPANIMLTRDGVKLLDFGIAQLRAERAGSLAATLSAELPTVEARPLPGTCAGTLHYMAPEQLQGRMVDARTDIFALGTVLYEVLTGRRPFASESDAGIVAAILHVDPPPFESLPAGRIPAQLEHLIRTCLAKDPEDRWQSARDVQRELSFIAEGRSTAGVPRGRRKRRLVWGALLATTAAVSLATPWVLRSSWTSTPIAAPAARVRFDVRPIAPAMLVTDQMEARVSPDGRHLAFVARQRSTTSLWIRSFDAAAAREIAGTEGASQLFWSPDGRSIGFHAQGALKRVSLDGGAVQILCLVPTMAGATWSPRGVIVFSQLNVLARVPDYGGTPVLMGAPAAGQGDAVSIWPQFLPDGERYLFRLVRGPRASQGIYVGSLDTPTFTRVLDTTSNVVPAGQYLLTVRSGSLMAQPFDGTRLAVSGEPVVLVDQVMENLGELGGPSVSVSGNGVLAYRTRHRIPTTLTWFQRSGVARETLAAPAGCRNPEISPDGRRVAVECPDAAANTRDIWVLDAISGRPARLTTDKGDDSDALWSPDGRWVVFSSGRDGGGRELYRRLATGAGADEKLFQTPRTKYPGSWSRDGKFILFTSREEGTGWDIWLFPLEGGKLVPIVSTAAVEIEPQLSPDGRWLAYTSDESGRLEVYVRPFRAPGAAWLISTGGGSDPRWRSDGAELYYLSPDRALMAVGIGAGAGFKAEGPSPLFQARMSGPLGLGVRFNYAVGAAGRRFLITADAPDTVPSAIEIVMNWHADVARWQASGR